ncbi:MAG: hypothetical protein KJ754_05420, partial [Bacteroidetes bacterium]|nr:hypothetical protein [Bacteroidota bacterium]
AIKYAELSVKIGYTFNFSFEDNELDTFISELVDSIELENSTYNGIENKAVFYDSISVDGRGLNIQYLRGLIAAGFNILYIASSSNIGNILNNEINNSKNVTLLKINAKDFSNGLQEILNSVTTFRPKLSFFHVYPWDILGISVAYKLSQTERYLINLTDHAFWFGTNYFDYFLEFRKFGAYIDLVYRGISPKKLLYQPFYPIYSNVEFAGFPINTENKFIAFTGGNSYKYFGKNLIFFDLIKEVILQNQNLIFFMAINGEIAPIVKYIKKNRLEDRIILIGDRNDIVSVLKLVDIYVASYPITGGLMSQLAILVEKPIIAYSDKNLFSLNDIEDLNNIKEKGLIMRTTKNGFVSYFNRLIKSNIARSENIKSSVGKIISESDFSTYLLNNINRKEPIQVDESIILDKEDYYKLFIEIENNFLKRYDKILFDYLKLKLILHSPLRFVNVFCNGYFFDRVFNRIKNKLL